MSDLPGDARLLDEIEARAYGEIVAAAPEETARALGLRASRAGGAFVLRAATLPSPLFNRAIGLGVNAPATEADLDAVLEELRGTTYYVHLSPTALPAELEEWMRRRGLVPAPRPAWAKVLRGREPAPEVDTALAVRELDVRQAAAFGAVATASFGMPLPLAPWFAAIVGRPGWRVFGAHQGDEMVAAGAVYIDGPRAWLGIGGTLPAHRRKHAQRALMARRIAAAIEEGCTVLATETGEPVGDQKNPSLDNMFACGFRRVVSRLNFHAPP